MKFSRYLIGAMAVSGLILAAWTLQAIRSSDKTVVQTPAALASLRASATQSAAPRLGTRFSLNGRQIPRPDPPLRDRNEAAPYMAASSATDRMVRKRME